MKSFDKAAGNYESFGQIQREMAGWLAEWLPPVREGPAMEAGAGTGFFTRHLLPWNGRLLATDASPAMVATGATSCPEAEWLVARAEDLPDVSVQWIFSSSYLQWANDAAGILRHWRTRLSPQGRILAGWFIAPTLPELLALQGAESPLTWRSEEEWEQAVAKAGLKRIRSGMEERVFHFPRSLDLFRTLHGIGAAPARRLTGPALRRLVAEYDRRFSRPAGVISTWTFYRLEAAAG